MARSPKPSGAFGDPLPNRAPVVPPPPNSSRPLPQLPVRGPAKVIRSNAIHRPSAPTSLSLNDIPLNGELINKALGLASGPTPPPAKSLSPIPPIKVSSVNYGNLPLPRRPPIPPNNFSSVNYGTLPLPHQPVRPSRSRRQGLIILLPADLPEELRNIQLDAQLSDDDST
ncbi:hypothetical protein PCANC_01113 [Puccinia coronata f. sp. avenae]|uniref:Uncharacterized protein n=1 Tax=Puccinia coronata f. sp. avenae TaxID=200324 RepID=A0A2N5V5X1_9BASI|nr:hypothetical protein PCANC_03197 [Puccinia coronata f. sp. avenae]PLW45393.1 hypothetical protein PCASD_03123 [Puccinia coronata f. sp. avenae]PLW57563.1 hypothetical protein PCANC_01113 [Puccinia coronata f. sp. avenae]